MKVALVGLVVFAAGCGGAHLTPTHGRSTRAFLERQRVTPAPQYKEAAKGLDAQESAIIAKSYRESLAPKGTRMEQEPEVLIIQQPKAMQQPQGLAPSVPKE
jgi:hypothetical protein